MYTEAVSQAIKKKKVHEYEIANKKTSFCFFVPNSLKQIDTRANEHVCSVCKRTSHGGRYQQREISWKCSVID